MKLRSQLILGYVLVIALLVLVSGITFRNAKLQETEEQWIAHTFEVIAKANLLQKLLVDMETGIRGFVITGTDPFLEPYDAGKDAYETATARLKHLVSDTPPQVERVEEIDVLVARWQKAAAVPEIAARRASSEAARALIQKGTGKAIMDTLRDRIGKFVEIEKGLLTERRKKADQTTVQTDYVTGICTDLGIFFGIVAMLYITRSMLRQIGGEPANGRRGALRCVLYPEGAAIPSGLKFTAEGLNSLRWKLTARACTPVPRMARRGCLLERSA